MHNALATRFARGATVARSESPLSHSAMRAVAPSIFAEAKHESRSERYTYIPTSQVLDGLGREGFLPFMVAQSRCRIPGKSEFTKHMVRLRHASRIGQSTEANEIILINSHDGASSYQMLAGLFRFVCMNGMVCGDIVEDVRIKHKGNVQHEVIDAAFRVLDGFGRVEGSADTMKQIRMDSGEQRVFANAAALLRFGENEGAPGTAAAPFDTARLLTARRHEDRGDSLWTTFQRVQENTLRGGLHGRNANGRNVTTREVQGIDRNVSLNRALWSLAEGMKALKTGEAIAA